MGRIVYVFLRSSIQKQTPTTVQTQHNKKNRYKIPVQHGHKVPQEGGLNKCRS